MPNIEDDAFEIALKIGREAYDLARGGLSEAEVRAKLASNREKIERELSKNLQRIRERDRR